MTIENHSCLLHPSLHRLVQCSGENNEKDENDEKNEDCKWESNGYNGLTILAFFILISIPLSNIAVIMTNKNYQLQSDSRYDYPM